MSNLSELLPTGGGQNAVDFVASENITAGQAVALRSDGEIEAADSGNQENVIGLAAEAITSGNTGAVNVFGGINEAQSGLTIGSNYYVNSSGSLTASDTKPYVALGQAISTTTLNLRDYPIVFEVVQGQQAYTTAGTYSWVAPAGTTSVSVVAVGGGGAGGAGTTSVGGQGGGGGGLGYKNAFSVTPLSSYTVVVGAGGTLYTGNGEDSYFINTSTVAGKAGQTGGPGNTPTAGGFFTGDGGGNGGAGGAGIPTGDRGGGGGGAGGYSGNGGAGQQNISNGLDGSGGGGGGGSAGAGGGGGGVGILGQGANGSGGVRNVSGAGGGSGGADGIINTTTTGTSGGAYGGGGGGGTSTNAGADGTGGAVRIIWGNNRAFPSTNTGDL